MVRSARTLIQRCVGRCGVCERVGVGACAECMLHV